MSLVLILLCLLASSAVCPQPVKAQYIGNIVIDQDGSISPLTAPIQRNGNLYTLISDIEGAVNTYHSNVILDGSGHTINEFLAESVSNITVKNFKVTMKNQFSENVGMTFNNTSNSWITNNTVTGFWSIYALNGILFAGIYVKGGNANTFTANTLLNNLDGIDFVDTSNNLFIGNNVTSNAKWSPYTTLINFIQASNNSIYQNNLINGTYQAKAYNSTNTWNNGNIGNYWTAYNGNGAYVIDENNIDHYPQTKPVDTTQITIPTPTPTVPEFTPLVILPLLLSIVGIAVVLRHRKPISQNKQTV